MGLLNSLYQQINHVMRLEKRERWTRRRMSLRSSNLEIE